MPDVLVHLLDLFSRYLHIVCATVLVGGTLFYEMVVPEAIDELKQEAQLGVFGRARWVFKRLVWGAALVLVLSGMVSTRKHWRAYVAEPGGPLVTDRQIAGNNNGAGPAAAAPRVPFMERDLPTIARRPGWWWVAHTSTGMLSVVIALYLTSTRQPPNHPIGWMRLNLVILMVVIFLASATRHVRSINEGANRGEVRIPFIADDT